MNFLKKLSILFLTIFSLLSCSKDDEKVNIPTEDHDAITKVVATVTQDGKTNDYTFEIGKPQPEITLKKNLNASIDFNFYNQNLNVTHEIIDEKDEHFIVFSFLNNDFTLTRTDTPITTRTDGAKLGLKIDIKSGQEPTSNTNALSLSLHHDPLTVNDSGIGSVTGGEIDLSTLFTIKLID